jgi:hypothetical protein
MRSDARLIVAVTTVTLIAPTRAGAWGVEGHRAVAAVAASRLKPAARTGVADLLRADTMESVASWADTVAWTTRLETKRWHFVNTPYDSTAYDATRDCRPTGDGDCAIAAIPRFEQVLLDRAASAQSRREALMFLIHIVGDLHNPLHAVQKNDTHDDAGPGGIGTQVELSGRTVNLHAAWDSGIIEAVGRSASTLSRAAEDWLTAHDEKAIRGTGPRDWAAESFRAGKAVAYPQAEDGKIDESERRAAMSVIEERIAMAGVRLAEVLNRVFAERSGAK